MAFMSEDQGIKHLDDKITEFGQCVVDFEYVNDGWTPTYLLNEENMLSINGLDFESCEHAVHAMAIWHVADRDDEREISLNGFDKSTTDNNLKPFSVTIKCLDKPVSIH